MSRRPATESGRTLVLILGDQLTPTLPALSACDPASTHLLMCEVQEEATYVPHHRRKIAFIFSAMRHFAAALSKAGWQVDYVRLDDPENTGSLREETRRAVARRGCASVRLTEPGEWRLRHEIDSWEAALGVPVEVLPDVRFLCDHAQFSTWAKGRTQLRMEYFYREMRRRTGVLMEGDQPLGGRWNFDVENRKPARRGTRFEGPLRFSPDPITREVLALVDARFPGHVGSAGPFWFAVTAEDAVRAQEHFVTHGLPGFGETQDAMLRDERFLNHAVLAQYLNVGLLDPLALARRAEEEFHAGRVPLAAAEGFVRQILGWREFVRGIYWQEMPGYAERNALGAVRALPDFYWTADTDLACLHAAISQTLDESWAHHIQRLMVTGTFALLAGINPQALHRWYLAVYADAFEWVELPNTLGMSQYADGGLLASKPYAASGAYLNRMSDYCGDCRYDVKQKTGPEACPFNALYWDFLARHEPRLRGNPRMAQMYRTWDKFSPGVRDALRGSAAAFLAGLDRPTP